MTENKTVINGNEKPTEEKGREMCESPKKKKKMGARVGVCKRGEERRGREREDGNTERHRRWGKSLKKTSRVFGSRSSRIRGCKSEARCAARKKNEMSRGRGETHEEVASIKTLCACFCTSPFHRRPLAKLWCSSVHS